MQNSSQRLWVKLSLCLIFLLLVVVVGAQCASVTAPRSTPAVPTVASGPTVQIGLLSPASGELNTFGRRQRNGIFMAFDRWNADGGLLGHRIEWRIYDTNCDFESGRQAAHQAIADGLRLIIGPLCSEAAIGAAVVAEANQVLMISPTATHPLVTVDGQGHTRATVFRAGYANPWQGQAAAKFAYERLEARSAALLSDPRDDYATTVTEAFEAAFVAQGGAIVYRADYPLTDTADLTGLLTAIQTAGSDLIYSPLPAPTANDIAGQLRVTPGLKNVHLLGSDRWSSSSLDLEAVSGSYFTLQYFSADENPEIEAWRNAYKATYAVEPDTLAVLGYDAANLLAQAIRQAGTFEPAAIAGALERHSEDHSEDHFYEGITGPFTFDAQHNPLKAVPVVLVEPEGIRLSTLIWP